MKLHFKELWPKHWIIVLVVSRWRPAFKRFNMIFSRASHRIEFSILDKPFFEQCSELRK